MKRGRPNTADGAWAWRAPKVTPGDDQLGVPEAEWKDKATACSPAMADFKQMQQAVYLWRRKQQRHGGAGEQADHGAHTPGATRADRGTDGPILEQTLAAEPEANSATGSKRKRDALGANSQKRQR